MPAYIVRHGQTEENLQKILQGHMPGTLTEEGKVQMATAAEELAKTEADFRCIVSSDLKRAIDSAQIIAERLHLEIVPMEMLRERDWGEFTGMSIEEAAKRFRINGKWEFPEGTIETEADIYARAETAIRKLNELYKDDTIIVVTHGLFTRNLIAARRGCQYSEVAPLINGEIALI